MDKKVEDSACWLIHTWFSLSTASCWAECTPIIQTLAVRLKLLITYNNLKFSAATLIMDQMLLDFCTDSLHTFLMPLVMRTVQRSKYQAWYNTFDCTWTHNDTQWIYYSHKSWIFIIFTIAIHFIYLFGIFDFI